MRYLTFISLCILFASIGMAADPITFWFDGNGSFHSDSAAVYMNNVLNGKVEDAAIRDVIRKTYPDATSLTGDQVEAIARKINALKTDAAYIFRSDADASSLKSQFSEARGKGKFGSVRLAGYGIGTQGGVEMMGGSNVNIAIIVPADKRFLNFLDDQGNFSQKKMESLYRQALMDPFWMNFTMRTSVDLMGKAYFDRLTPGPYLVWVNQYGILRYLYHVQVLPGTKKEIQLEHALALKPVKLDLPKGKKPVPPEIK